MQLQGDPQPPPAHLAVGLSHLLHHSPAGGQGPLQAHGDSCPGAPYPPPLPDPEGREAEQRQPHGPGSCPWSQVSPVSCKQVRKPLEFGGAGGEGGLGSEAETGWAVRGTVEERGCGGEFRETRGDQEEIPQVVKGASEAGAPGFKGWHGAGEFGGFQAPSLEWREQAANQRGSEWRGRSASGVSSGHLSQWPQERHRHNAPA